MKTDLISNASLSPNLGIEFSLSRQFTLATEYSCTKEVTDISPEVRLPATIRVEVKAHEMNGIYSRAIDETKINDLHVLIYDQKGELIGHSYSEQSTIEVKTLSGNNCTIHAIANTADPSLFDGTVASTEQKLKDKTTTLLNSWEQFTSSTQIVMTGSRSGINITPKQTT